MIVKIGVCGAAGKMGKAILQKQNCWQPYFMAPSHSFDTNTLKALVNLDFVSISDGYGFFPYMDNGILHVPQLSSKPYKFIPGISTICIHVNNMSDREIQTLVDFVNSPTVADTFNWMVT